MAELNSGTDRSTTIRSGIAPLDALLGGGIAAGRIHLLTGGVGTGKTIAALQFLGVAVGRGENAALLTSSRPADVLAQAAYAGIPIGPALRARQLVALRYRSGFATRVAHATVPKVALDDLQRMLGSVAPARIAIDSVLPFLGEGAAARESLTALAEFLEELGATALLTLSADVSQGSDRRFDGLLERAATVTQITRATDGAFTLNVLRGRAFGAAGASGRFTIAPRAGIVGAGAKQPAIEQVSRAAVVTSRRLMLLHATDAAAPEILDLVHRDYDASVSPLAIGAAQLSGANGASALLIETHYGSLAATRAFVRSAVDRNDCPPLIVVVRFNLRSIDRARLLREGVDEVLATDMSAPEFLQRLAAAVTRGHLARPVIEYSERMLTQAEAGGEIGDLLDPGDFARAVAAHREHDHPVQYTVVTLAPPRATRGTDEVSAVLAELAELAMRMARLSSGDLVACVDGRLAVYLHGARRGEAAPFVERVRGAWPARERGSIDVDFLSYPSDELRLRTLLDTSLQS